MVTTLSRGHSRKGKLWRQSNITGFSRLGDSEGYMVEVHVNYVILQQWVHVVTHLSKHTDCAMPIPGVNMDFGW